MPAGVPHHFQGVSERNILDSELGSVISQLHRSLKTLLGSWIGSEQPGNQQSADLRQQGLRAVLQLQLVRDAILNLNSLSSISNMLEDFMQLCYTVLGVTAKILHLPGRLSWPSWPQTSCKQLMSMLTSHRMQSFALLCCFYHR